MLRQIKVAMREARNCQLGSKFTQNRPESHLRV